MSQTVPIFRSELQESVLRALFQSDEPLSSAEIARVTGEPTSSVSREVRTLTRAGVLTTLPVGRRSVVSFDESSPVVPGMRMILSAITRRGFPATIEVGMGGRVAPEGSGCARGRARAAAPTIVWLGGARGGRP